MKEFIPHDMILRAQKYKYKYLAIPGALIFINFLLRNHVDHARYVSLLALLFYFFLLIVFRFRRAYPDHENGDVIAPITGKIARVETLPNGSVVTIQKSLFDSSEIVTCTNADLINKLDTEQEHVSWKIEGANTKIFTDLTVNYKSVLIGLAAGNATCEVFIPSRYELIVNEGNKIEGGISVIAEEGEKEDE